jgi:beta-lactamase class A
VQVGHRRHVEVRCARSGEARGERASTRRSPRRSSGRSRSFATALAALDAVAAAGAQVSVCVTDLDSGETVLAGDATSCCPSPARRRSAADRGRGADRRGHARSLQIIERSSVAPVTVGGLWHRLAAPALPVRDLAVLAAAASDAAAANALLERVGLEAVRARSSRSVS